VIKVRSQQITIEVPKEGAEPWVRIVVQRVERNGDIVNTVDRWDSFNKRLSDVVAEQFPIPESINCETGTFTFVDVASAITTVVIVWLAQRYNGMIQPNGDVIIEE
jgi:hypothetical protein